VTPDEPYRPSSEDDGRERLERMFRSHHEIIWRLFRRMGFAADAAGDLTQQVFLIAAERLKDIRRPSERAFLFGTAMRLGRTAWRRGRRLRLDDDMDVHADPKRRPEELAEQHSAIELVDQILAKMDEDLLAVFVLFEIEGFSAPEIARDLSIPVGTVASRLRRAREAFRSQAARTQGALGRKVVI
jgi:RNA polymerase sigma-70 factor, ECF subfamily